MVEIRTLDKFNPADLERIGPNYTSTQRYVVTKTETHERFNLTLELVELDTPYTKGFMRGAGLYGYYREMLDDGFSLGAYDERGQMIGIAIAQSQAWNRTLNVWEFHVLPRLRGQGVGTQMMARLIEKAQAARLRVIELETSVSNIPAVRFYRKQGFTIESLDLSYYSNEDVERGDVAIFMKRTL
ncbi:MAG: GNAT family N-acetyltransferase [bacterium]|nr:GNAT family N-acetyltransferase [bacterium]